MLKRLTNPESAQNAARKISELFSIHAEWFYTSADGRSEALRRQELDISVSQGRLILSLWTERGARSWRIIDWDMCAERLLFHTARRRGAERPVIELVPRASASAIAATIRAARQLRCDQLAQLAASLQPGMKIERASLSPGIRHGQPGRYGRILLRSKYQRIAVTASVVSSYASEVDALLSSALIWFQRLSERIRAPYLQQLWLAVEKPSVKPLGYRIALLRESLKEAIVVYEIDQAWTVLDEILLPSREDLWKRRLPRFPPVTKPEISEAATKIMSLDPDAIDVVHARHGQTLRYFGLPFARVRQIMDAERVWFGIESSRRTLLEKETEHEFVALLQSLKTHRSADALDHRHALYRTAAEAWLESLLRRDISQLDPGLLVAPLHAQFRIAKGGRLGVRPIDLLALRKDGRLVVIELKVSEDREHVLQGADYWQRVEAHRRRGHIAKARLFGGLGIRDETPLVYLVAPTLRIHPSFHALARSIASDVEIYRFDINEDWRSRVRVMRRQRVN